MFAGRDVEFPLGPWSLKGHDVGDLAEVACREGEVMLEEVAIASVELTTSPGADG